MTDSTILEQNLAALARFPQVVDALRPLEPYPAEWIEMARSGDPIISVPGRDGEARPLHSRYQPRNEARRLLPG